jgi:hypothetical protein
MWQAMAKNPASISIAITPPLRLIRQKYAFPRENFDYFTSLRLQQSRAPPA